MSREQSARVAAMLRARAPGRGDMTERRAGFAAWARSLSPEGAPPGRAATVEPGIDGLWLDPPGGPTTDMLLWLHGGAFMVGSSETYRPLAHALATEAELSVFVPDYPLAPERPFPAALDACGRVFDLLEAAGHRVVVCGDSAGGNLAAAMVQDRLRVGRLVPAGVWLLSPYLDLTHAGESWQARAAADPFLPASDDSAARFYTQGANPADPRVSPLFGPVEGFPPALIQVGSDEMLYSDSRNFTMRLWAAGCHAVFQEWVGQAHVWPIFMASLDEGGWAVAQGAHFARRALGRDGGLP